MPLALELAASWVMTLSPAEIRAQVAEDTDLLAAEAVDRPARQQSMRRTLEYSWELLDEAEQDTLARLSVFRGGFTHEAAAVAAGATLPVLRNLVNHSQIRHDATRKRYFMHELLRQFAAERLREKGDEAAARLAHSEYFGQWLAERQPLMGATDTQLDTLANIERELSNVQSGFLYAAEQALPQLEEYLPGMWEYLFRQEHTERGEALFRQALEQYPEEGNATRDHLYIVYASQVQVRRLFRELSTERDAILSRLAAIDSETLSPHYLTLYRLAFLDRHLMREDPEAYDQIAADAVASARAAGQSFLEALSLYVAIERKVDRSLWDQFARLVRRTGDRYVASVVLTFDGLEQLVKGRVNLAERQLRQAYKTAGEVDDVYGQVKIADRLCRVLIVKHELEEALLLLDEIAGQIETYDFAPVWVEYAVQLARVRMAQGDLAGAAEALQGYSSDYPLWTGVAYWLAYARDEPLPDPAQLLTAMAEWILPSGHEVDRLIARAIVELDDGQEAAAVETLAEVIHHPAAPPWYASEHPVVKRLIKEIGDATQASHQLEQSLRRPP